MPDTPATEVIDAITRMVNSQKEVNDSFVALCVEMASQITGLRTRVRELEERELRRMKATNYNSGGS